MTKNYRNYTKTSKTPKRPFEKERLHNEYLALVDLIQVKDSRNLRLEEQTRDVESATDSSKTEVPQLHLHDYRKAARQLLTLDATDPRRLFEGEALIRRMVRLGLLQESERKLDYVLGLNVDQFMERRLQTLVAKRKLANSVHHSRVLIKQKHISIGKQVVNIPSFMVRVSSEQHIQTAPNSVYKTGKMGRTKKKKAKGGKGDEE